MRIGRIARLAAVVAAGVWVWAFPAGVAGAVVQARPADLFVDSIGVNTHYVNAIYTAGPTWHGNGYADPALDQKLADLGIRHLRDNALDASSDANRTAIALGRIDGLYLNHGIGTTIVFGSTANSPAAIVNVLKAHPAIEAVEGLNEPDFNTRSYGGFTDNPATNSYPATRAFQNDLFAAVKGDPQTASRHVLSAAMGNTSRMQYLHGTDFDAASMHSYPVARNPTFNLDTHVTRTNQSATPPKPIWATETGYYNKPADQGEVSELAAGKYLPRLFAEYFNRGIARTYTYELVDQNPTNDRESNFGLLRHDLTPKPAYVAMKNLIDLLKEPGAGGAFEPGILDYTLTAPSSVHQTLLQKSDGTFYLMLWNEALSWDRINHVDLSVADVPATLALHGADYDVRAFQPNLSADPLSTYAGVTSLDLSVPDQMLVLELTQVPEPASAALLLGGAALLLRRCRSAA